ncbi:MAG: tetratricopeptide repeat protein [Tissierellaceae bacterium]
MLISRITLFISTLTILLILWKGLNLSYLVSALITLAIIMIGYIIIGLRRSNKRINLLDKDLDPEAFIEAIEKQRKITGKNRRINTYLDYDLVAGLISMGRYEEAKDIIDNMNIKYIPKWNGALLGYYNNKMILLYNLGKKDEADEIFEKYVKTFPLKTPTLKYFMKIILAVKNFEEGNFEECKELCNEYLSINKNKRIELELLYMLAEIDEEQGDIESAREKYNKIAKEGNKLYTAFKAREKISE